MDDSFKSSVKALRVDGVEFSMHAPFVELNLGSYFQEDRVSSMGKLKSALDMARNGDRGSAQKVEGDFT